MNRVFRATRRQLAEEDKPKDICAKHGMHKVYYGDSWRCGNNRTTHERSRESYE